MHKLLSSSIISKLVLWCSTPQKKLVQPVHSNHQLRNSSSQLLLHAMKSFHWFSVVLTDSLLCKWTASSGLSFGSPWFVLVFLFLHSGSWWISMIFGGFLWFVMIGFHAGVSVDFPCYTLVLSGYYSLAVRHPRYFIPMYAPYLPLMCMLSPAPQLN